MAALLLGVPGPQLAILASPWLTQVHPTTCWGVSLEAEAPLPWSVMFDIRRKPLQHGSHSLYRDRCLKRRMVPKRVQTRRNKHLTADGEHIHEQWVMTEVVLLEVNHGRSVKITIPGLPSTARDSPSNMGV